MFEVRRASDGELCGYVRADRDLWRSVTVFGGTLARHDDRPSAEDHVLSAGLASLAERWWFRPDSASDWQIVCIQEASPQAVRLALGYYSMPGVPTLTVSAEQLRSGAVLTLERPAD